MLQNCIEKASKEHFCNLPPPVRARLEKILTDHGKAILYQRASVVRERRGDGRPYWRLYLEYSSAPDRHRQRVYVGPQGGPELQDAILELRRCYWMGCDDAGAFLKAVHKLLSKRGQHRSSQ